MAPRRIKKRDGREVPFDKAKIRAAVEKAQVAVGDPDPGFAAEVADVVELLLARRPTRGATSVGAGAVPGIEEIQDLVEQVLIELGRAPVAKAYILYRDKRARMREALRVVEHEREPSVEAPARRAGPTVQEADALGRWSKGRIVAALVGEAGLARETAEQVATAVETRVFQSGLKRISTTLVRELVAAELAELGLSRALERHGPLGLARHDLRALVLEPGLASEPRGPGPWRVARRVEDALSGELLRRLALEEALPQRVVEACLRGELWLEDLGAPQQDLVRALPCELLAPGASEPFALLEPVADELARCSTGVALEGLAGHLGPLTRARRGGDGEPSPALAGFVRALRALARGARRRIDLVPLAAGDERGRRLAECAALCSALAAPEALLEPPWLRVLIDTAGLELLLASEPRSRPALERLLASGRLVPTWGRDEQVVGPGLARSAGEQGVLALGGACALNLARLAREAGPWREEAFLEALVLEVELAFEALAAWSAWRRALVPLPAGASFARERSAVVPVGLREALRALGDGELRAEQGARVLAVLDELVRRRSVERGLGCRVSTFLGEAARTRFAEQDAERQRGVQHLLFPTGPADAGRPIAYGVGLDLGPAPTGEAPARLGAREGELAAGLALGALWPPPALLAGADALTRLARFEERRRRVAESLPRERPAPAPDLPVLPLA